MKIANEWTWNIALMSPVHIVVKFCCCRCQKHFIRRCKDSMCEHVFGWNSLSFRSFDLISFHFLVSSVVFLFSSFTFSIGRCLWNTTHAQRTHRRREQLAGLEIFTLTDMAAWVHDSVHRDGVSSNHQFDVMMSWKVENISLGALSYAWTDTNDRLCEWMLRIDAIVIGTFYVIRPIPHVNTTYSCL